MANGNADGNAKEQERRAKEARREALAAKHAVENAAHRKAKRDRAHESRLQHAEENAAQGAHVLASAWRVSKLAVGLLALCLAWVWCAKPVVGIGATDGSGMMITGLLGVMALIAVGVGMHWVSKPIDLAVGNGFDWLVFVTWFWLPFALAMPVAGTVMAWVRVYVLYRGQFAASTIESNSSTSSYSAVTLENGEGRPAALLFLALGTLWPLTVLGLLA